MTDGLIEQKNQDGVLYKSKDIDRIFKSHSNLSAKELRNKLLTDFNRFKGITARQDDISFIILKYSPVPGQQETGSARNKIKLEDKIKWAISTGKPIQIRTNRYLTEDRDFIDFHSRQVSE